MLNEITIYWNQREMTLESTKDKTTRADMAAL